jgi:hypothetical protein
VGIKGFGELLAEHKLTTDTLLKTRYGKHHHGSSWNYFQHAAEIQVYIAVLTPPIKLLMYNSPSLNLKVLGYIII